MNKLVKAEILFSRECRLSCTYCGMKNGKENNVSVEDWLHIIHNLKTLGCEFIAFYGAEPLMEFDKLVPVVGFAEKLGIDTTVITAGVVPMVKQKLYKLNAGGARSLSMSYDPNPEDKSMEVKSNKAVELLTYFQKLDNVRDVAAIATLHKHNFRKFPEMVTNMTDLGIWSFFDLIHDNRGQPGTKCANVPPDLMLTKEDYKDFVSMLEIVLEMKSLGFLCHTTENYVNVIRESIEKTGGLYGWTCCKQPSSWITIDCDGLVIPCDDFYPRYGGTDAINLIDNWDLISSYVWPKIVRSHGCHCAWNTHIDAHGIAAGNVKITDYVHGRTE